MTHHSTGDPQPADPRAALACVLASTALCASPESAALLRFLVDVSMSGTTDRVDAATIATSVFGRGTDCGPDGDPIVRLQADRLRRALTAYYAGEGAHDPLIIDMSPDAYHPTYLVRFLVRNARTPASQKAGGSDVQRPLLAGVALLALFSACLFTWRYLFGG